MSRWHGAGGKKVRVVDSLEAPLTTFLPLQEASEGPAEMVSAFSILFDLGVLDPNVVTDAS